jgi:pyruvate kinase
MVDMSTIYKRTKILATIGPASDSEEMIEKLIRGGINGARLNFSHGSYDEHATKIKAVREISKKVGKEVYYTLDDDHVRKVFEIGLEHINHKL